MKYFTAEIMNSMVSVLQEICSMDVEMTDDAGSVIFSKHPARYGETIPSVQKLFAAEQTSSIDPDSSPDAAGQGWLVFSVQYSGVRLGAISVYGDIEKLTSYSQTLQNVTNMLIEVNLSYARSQFKSNTITLFVNEWLHLDTYSDYSEFKDLAKILGVDLNLPRTVVNLHIHNLQSITAAFLQKGYTNRISEMIQQQIIESLDKEKRDFCISSGNDFILLITGDNISDIRRTIEQIKQTIERKFSVSVIAGFSPIAYDYRDVQKYYRYAQLSTRVARTQNRSFAFYSDLSIELLLSTISPQIKQEYVRKIFRDASEADLKEWMNILFVYFKCNGSLSSTAQKLYLHKNTLQYKLGKIREQTGFDARNKYDSVVLYLALYIYLEIDPGIS